eukprot:1136584-Pelagomonas_calceolata.AAC.2
MTTCAQKPFEANTAKTGLHYILSSSIKKIKIHWLKRAVSPLPHEATKTGSANGRRSGGLLEAFNTKTWL